MVNLPSLKPEVQNRCATLVACISGICLGLFTINSAFCVDWQQYRGPFFNGTSPESGVGDKLTAKNFKLLWKIPLHGGFSSFSVSGKRVFTLDKWMHQGAPREFCVAFDADSGKQLWETEVGIARYDYGYDAAPFDGPRSTPTINDGKVYVLNARLVLYCLDAQTGKVLWTKDLVKEHKALNISWQSAASPVIEDNLIFICAGGIGQSLLGINKTSGKTIWQTQDDGMTHATPVPVTIHGVRQIVFMTQKGLVSVQPENGKVLWRQSYPYGASTAASPVIGSDIVYCSAGYGIGSGAFKVTKSDSGWAVKQLWRKVGNKYANHWSTPVYHNGFLYGIFGFKQYKTAPLKCLEIATGNERWSKDGFGPGNLILVDNKLIVLSDQGQVVIMEPNPKEYIEISRFQGPNGNCWSTPAFANGRLYLRSHKEGVCFELIKE